ncbi:MAG: site-specific DNA-methyltransferase [Deltaproteobacteria bacterium]|nr:site-specific DNA-methyltransferase [Deltaproteobacteria bacterium]
MENEIIHGDCIEVMQSMPSESVDLIVTDPPYLINYKTGHRKDRSHKFCTTIANDDNAELIAKYISECYRILKPDTAMYMFCSADKVDFFKEQLDSVFEIRNMIVWVKNNWTAGDLTSAFGRQYELLFLVNKGRKEFSGTRISDVWRTKRVAGLALEHQNQKPVEIIERCILKHSEENDLVFDGFAGSGTTAVAAVYTNRRYICVEKDSYYYALARERVAGLNASVLFPDSIGRGLRTGSMEF